MTETETDIELGEVTTIQSELPATTIESISEGSESFETVKFLALIPLIFAIGLYFFPAFISTWTISVGAFVLAITILYNFPHISRMMHTRRRGYEDLADREALSGADKTQFQDLFIKVINIPLAICVTVLVNYGLFQYHRSNLNNVEIVGMIGGLLSLYGRLHKFIGYIVLHMVHKHKVKHVERRRTSSIDVSQHDGRLEIPVDRDYADSHETLAAEFLAF